MTRVRVSIAGLMALVAVVALGVVGLREGTELWAGGAFTLTALILLGAIPGAAYGRGPRRAAWVGFALFGWAYLLWNFSPWSGTGMKPPPMLIDYLLNALHERIHPAPQYIPNPQYTGPPMLFPGSSLPALESPMILKPGTAVWEGNETSYRQVGHCLGALAFGLLGAVWSRHVHARGVRAPDGADGGAATP